MVDINEQVKACEWEATGDDSHPEAACSYVEINDGSYDNPCAQEMDECCCC